LVFVVFKFYLHHSLLLALMVAYKVTPSSNTVCHSKIKKKKTVQFFELFDLSESMWEKKKIISFWLILWLFIIWD